MAVLLSKQRENEMLLDHRTYTVKPGTLGKHLKIYEEYGLAVQKKHLGEPLAYLIAESGELNTYVHIWVYKDAAERFRIRDEARATGAWPPATRGLFVQQENMFVVPAEFSPLR